MYLLHSDESSLSEFLEKFTSSVKAALRSATPVQSNILIERGTNILALSQERRCLFVIGSGAATVSFEGKAIVSLESGDVIGLESLMPLAVEVSCGDFAITADQYDLKTIDDPKSFALHYLAVLVKAYAAGIEMSADQAPNILNFKAGETIVREAELGADIYTLLEGKAEVSVGGKIIGEIKPEEVFGALAALGNLPRTATVRATEPTLVVSVTKDRLVDLIKFRPQIIEKLIGDLARVIQNLNAKLGNN